MWLEAYLTNGKIKKTEVISVKTEKASQITPQNPNDKGRGK